MTSPRVAFAGFIHETNTFAPTKADYATFVGGSGHRPMSRGQEIIAAVEGANTGTEGALNHARMAGWEIVPILRASAVPSAHVTQDAFERISSEIVDSIVASLPLDGIFLDLHGAMVAEHVDDGEGELLARIRQAIGYDIPISVCLDLHGNITEQSMKDADMLVGYRTYPHVDMADTGRRAAELLDRLMSGERFAKAYRQIDYLIPISWQCTTMEPAKSVYSLVEALEKLGDMASTSFFFGFPAADIAACGASVLAYGKTQSAADAAADEIKALVDLNEPAFAGKVFTPDEGVREAMRIAAMAKKPVVISDTQDNPGAGGDSNTTGMLRALIDNDAQNASLGLFYDPAAALAAQAAGVGATIRLALGGQSGIAGDEPYEADFVVEAISDGNTRVSGPFYGNAPMHLGPSACLRIGGVRVAVASQKVQMADRGLFRYLGIEPEKEAILVNKSSVHFRADFEPIAETIIVCAAPGPMAVSPASLPWTKLRPGIRLAPLGSTFA
ncbi:M81 family metallopeptidase [Neorhizobium sp. JUb45]|uniref:M81 family metallopeptidase n=1 Tax=unclassified Neorhizobium TaxID=2629175 RepID=UPI00104D3AED|nr:M81 family metallopeptidase [Neorhizobium sp. JUb45]TCR02658.1 microcystin degradation protein MlrC [Neorhizobium sp. JUb45]